MTFTLPTEPANKSSPESMVFNIVPPSYGKAAKGSYTTGSSTE